MESNLMEILLEIAKKFVVVFFYVTKHFTFFTGMG
jgi:ABC-type antimicrobial peptide transport system ATPase subunit